MIKNTDKLIMLMVEISIAKSRLEPHDTGHIHTSISWLQQRVEEIKNELEKEYVDINDVRQKYNRHIWDNNI
tara:strand:+ start:492 stop:707 length:216 start_codon:yes stop_codon:yes gene_type:complete